MPSAARCANAAADRRLAAGASGANTLCKHARYVRCSRGPCVIHTLCPPFTTAVATVCSEIMMTSEMETNETMQKTENTMEEARLLEEEAARR